MMIRKELGQHFVNDKKFLKREVGYANIGQDETVLEIGPGIGNLTEILLKKAKKIIAKAKVENTKIPIRNKNSFFIFY